MSLRFIITLLLMFNLIATNTDAQGPDVFVNSYLKKDGSYVQPHYRTSPNLTLFDNYSTKGNYNPYTGKPGWIDPYRQYSSYYYQNIPLRYQKNYKKVFEYLQRGDSISFFNVVNNFNRDYNLFFTGLFNINQNNFENAYRIFYTLSQASTKDEFIRTESAFWAEFAFNYTNASTEAADLYKMIAKKELENNSIAVIELANKIINPLNLFDKFLIKFIAEYKVHRYGDAKMSLDSIIYYAPSGNIKDTLNKGRGVLLYDLDRRLDYLKAQKNKTYYYTVDNLQANFIYYFKTNSVPLNQLSDACFTLDLGKCSLTDTVLNRTFIDTSQSSFLKADAIYFHKQVQRNGADTGQVMTLKFRDSSTYLFYQNILSQNILNIPISQSLLFKFENATGQEYLLTKNIIVGLIRDNSSENIHYEIYLYSFSNKNGIYNLTNFFN